MAPVHAPHNIRMHLTGYREFARSRRQVMRNVRRREPESERGSNYG